MRISDWSSDVCSSDLFRGFASGNIDYFSHIDQAGFPDWWQQKSLHPEDGYLTEIITDHAIDFIEQAQKHPFFLYLAHGAPHYPLQRSEEHTSELQSLMRISSAVFCLTNKTNTANND